MLEELLRTTKLHPVFRFRLTPANTAGLDLSRSNPDPEFQKIATLEELQDYIGRKLAASAKPYACGGYGEHRAIYRRFSHFNTPGKPERDYHLGVDVWCPAHEPLFAPLEGRVHSFANNDRPGDYGGTIILQHEFQGQVFHTLYGHLSQASLQGKQAGQRIAAGEQFAELGAPHENGGWPPHLHLQLILDMEGHAGDYPGVASAEVKERYLDNCPCPEIILGFEEGVNEE